MIADKTLETVAEFKYLERTVTDQIYIHKELKAH
jgi:hypothetical protein